MLLLPLLKKIKRKVKRLIFKKIFIFIYWRSYNWYNAIFIQRIMARDRVCIQSRSQNHLITNQQVFLLNLNLVQPDLTQAVSQLNVLYVVHWFELGGAESYALYTVKTAKKFGHCTFLISTVPGDNQDLEKFAAYADEILDYTQIGGYHDYLTFILNYIGQRKINILHIHHSAWTYYYLPVIKAIYPYLKVIDSTHIIEYTTNYERREGGFPWLSIFYHKYIDIHNVISHHLANYINEGIKKIDPNQKPQIMLCYLANLNNNHTIDNRPFKVEQLQTLEINLLFYARFAEQKQPNLFLEVVKYLNNISIRHRFTGIMVGSGPLEAGLKKAIAKREDIKLLGRNDNKEEVFNLAPILLLTSLNEGLTLTSFEAVHYGTLVVSTDVGAQAELIPEEALVNVLSPNIVTDLAQIVLKCVSSVDFAQSIYDKEIARLRQIEHDSVSENDICKMYSVG